MVLTALNSGHSVTLVDKKVERWYIKNIVSEWIGEFTGLSGGAADSGIDTGSFETEGR